MDAAADAGVCATCIGTGLSWRDTGGFRMSRRSSALASCRDYTLTEMSSSPPATTTCGNVVPCGVASAVSIEDLNAALANADVVAAFAAAPITYGRDMRPVDGSVFEVTQGGHSVVVGIPCSGSITCTPIPAGVQALMDLLRRLDAERLAEPDCSTVFP